MFGGHNNNPVLPVFLEENRFQYENNALPRLQLFGDCPFNNMGNENTTSVNRPIKRGREAEPTLRQQSHHISVNNNLCLDEAGQPRSVLNPNPVSTGLRLSYEEDERNSSVTSVSGNVTTSLPVMLSLGDNLKAEIDRQKEEFDYYVRLQEDHILKGVRELKQRQTISFLNAIEKGVGRKLQEKELEIENMNRKNKELVEKIKQVSMEVQSWHYRAKYNESIVNALKSNLKQVMEQGAVHSKEGCGESEVDDAASYTNQNHLDVLDGSGNSFSLKKQINCRACKIMEVSVLLLPCRHLCLCKDCEGFIDVCPVCQVMKTAKLPRASLPWIQNS
ncbi:SBP family protein [Theobroma cacao]|uniref:SBP family protein n=1 Tax=Theobroma cacao TaxID=3641 RepID=A0A061G148_THECC|nr:SBP family protein [Theobroma cacao]